MKEGRHFSLWKFLPDTKASTIRDHLSQLDLRLRAWYEDKGFVYATRLAPQWNAQLEIHRLRMVVKAKDEQEHWFVRIRGSAVPHIIAAVESQQRSAPVARTLPSPSLTKMLLDGQSMDIGVPDPGGVSCGRTAAMYIRFNLWALPAGRAMLGEELKVGSKAASHDLFALLDEVFTDANLASSSVAVRRASIRAFLRDSDRLAGASARDRIETAVAAMQISPEEWWRATAP